MTKYHVCRGGRVELATALLLLVVVLSGAPALASSGITPPVSFEESDDEWQIELQVMRDDVEELTVSRELRRAGKPISTSAISAPYVAGVTRFLEIPLNFDGMAVLPDGAYSQSIRIVAELTGGASKPYTDHKTVYFLVEGGRARRVDIKEYSQVTDPTVIELNANGRNVRVHQGTAVPGASQSTSPAVERFAIDERVAANHPTPPADDQTVESEENEE